MNRPTDPRSVVMNLPRRDALDKLTGRTRYTSDLGGVEVLHASVPGLRLADAQRAVLQRSAQHWKTLEEAGQALGDSGKVLSSSSHQLASNFFEVIGRVRLGSTTVLERSVIQRDDNQRILWRERGVLAGHMASLQ